MIVITINNSSSEKPLRRKFIRMERPNRSHRELVLDRTTIAHRQGTSRKATWNHRYDCCNRFTVEEGEPREIRLLNELLFRVTRAHGYFTGVFELSHNIDDLLLRRFDIR